MTPLGQIVQKNLSCFDSDAQLLWINPPPDGSWQAMGNQVTLLCQNFSHWQQISQAGGSARFASFPGSESFQQVLLSLPHSKAKLQMMLDCAAAVLGEDGKLWLAGENRAGIRSAGTSLNSRFKTVRVIDRARHCRLYEAAQPLYTGAFEQDSYCQHWQLEKEFASLELRSWPGVFAHGRLDEGTRMLLQVVPSLEVKGQVLDFGCGCGVISASLIHHHNSIDLTLLDVDALALLSAETTLAANQMQAKIMPGHGLQNLGRQYDLVISNPPFHEGHLTDTQLSTNLMDPKGNYLAPEGSVVLVVNRHLSYVKWLDRNFGGHRVLAKNSRYQVLQATPHQ